MNTFFAQLEARTGLCDPVTMARDMGVDVPERDVVGPFTLGVTSTEPADDGRRLRDLRGTRRVLRAAAGQPDPQLDAARSSRTTPTSASS